MGGQRWVFMRHPETGGTTWVPDNPGVVKDQGGRGWQVAEPERGQRPPGTYRSNHERLAKLDRQTALLEITCDGGKRHPHDLEVLLVAGRDLRPGGTELFIRGSEWDWRDGGDGFKYGTAFPSQTSPICGRCQAKPTIAAKKLEMALDAMLRDSKGAPVVQRVDFRVFASVRWH